jgi:hypothetical protein
MYIKKTPLLSEKAPKPRKPQTKSEFGYFLAGLIDADGHINKNGYIEIAFHTNEISVAYYIKKVIGFGSISHKKSSFVSVYSSSSKIGTLIIADLIRHKLKHFDKINQFNSRIVPRYFCEPTLYTSSELLHNHWLAGFIQGDGSLTIKLVMDKRPSTPYLEVRLRVDISQKAERLLNLIAGSFGGSSGYNKNNDCFYYSCGFASAARFIFYLDEYQLIGNKLKQFFIWRSAYVLVQSQKHLTASGKELIRIKKEKLTLLRSKRLSTLSGKEREARRLAKKLTIFTSVKKD